jgi:hypothetical protein
MPHSVQHAADLNKSFVDFVITDLDAALTFMDFADISDIVEAKQRNHRNARKAYDSVIGLLEKLWPDAAQQADIDLKLATLKNRLAAVGQKF